MKRIRSLVGLLTIAAAIASGVFIWRLADPSRTDPQHSLRLLFENAQGLEPGARVKYLGVSVGEVRDIRLADDQSSVEVVCVIDPEARRSLRVSSRFWIVRPIFRGVVQGASGLETMVRDPYIAYDTPNQNAPPLEGRAVVPGLSTAPVEKPKSILERAYADGAFRFSVVVAENARLAAGSEILHRGIKVGEVLRVSLAPQGEAVWIQGQVARRYRSTVTRGTLFWLGRPAVDIGWISGVDVKDIDTIIQGPHLAYATPTQSDQTPAPDGFTFRGLPQKPDIVWGTPPLPDRNQPQEKPPDSSPNAATRLCYVYYHCIEKDFVRDDIVNVTSLGIFFRTADGIPVVLTNRTGVDPSYHAWDRVGRIDVRNERISVRLSDGSVHNAGRVWSLDEDSAPNQDLALLRLEETDFEPRVPLLSFESPGVLDNLRILAAARGDELTERRARYEAGAVILNQPLDLPFPRGGVIVAGDRIVGLLSQIDEDESVEIAWLSGVPAALRPDQSERP